MHVVWLLISSPPGLFYMSSSSDNLTSLAHVPRFCILHRFHHGGWFDLWFYTGSYLEPPAHCCTLQDEGLQA